MKNESGFAMTEALVYLAISAILLAVAFPKGIAAARRAATKAEMSYLAATIVLAEVENGALPNSLTSLTPTYYAPGSGQDKDAFGVSYQYNKIARTLCSVSFTPSYCVNF